MSSNARRRAASGIPAAAAAGSKGSQRVEVEVGALPGAGHDGREDGALLVGRATVDVDHAQERPRDGLDRDVVDRRPHAAATLPRGCRRPARPPRPFVLATEQVYGHR
jgi:hypothetical protein